MAGRGGLTGSVSISRAEPLDMQHPGHEGEEDGHDAFRRGWTIKDMALSQYLVEAGYLDTGGALCLDHSISVVPTCDR